MRLGVLTRDEPVLSLRAYRENLEYELARLGVEVTRLSVNNLKFDNIEVVWDPGLLSTRFPHPTLQHCSRPIVATIHGLASHTLSIREYYPDPVEAVLGQAFHDSVTAEWEWFGQKISKVIAVSRYGADEVISVFKIPREKVTAIYHGLDHDIFNTSGEKMITARPYLLHIAQFAPKKNLERVLEAFTQLTVEKRPDLIVILPNYEGEDPEMDGIRIIRESLTHEELACWYRGAVGFVFPSIHETFGMPVLEAMACGCPVLTANLTAMPELAGDAAIQVNPRSVEEIANGMRQLIEDKDLGARLRGQGLEQARLFSWEKSAREHLGVFESVR